MMGNTLVIMKKQWKDTLKNKTVLIQFILFPLMTLVMENVISMEGMPEHFFVRLFSVMYVGMAPLTSAAAIIAEEKEQNTLRVLIMANVKPVEYLLGVGIYLWLLCMVGSVVMGTVAGFKEMEFLTYEAVMAMGILLSVLLGSAIGIYSDNQMMATSISLPVMLVLSFAPMLAQFNEKIAGVAQILYTEQMSKIFMNMSLSGTDVKGYVWICVNIAFFLALFLIIFKKKGLEQ
ncbi:MAG: ABC transporter permease [Agathobacter sp.]